MFYCPVCERPVTSFKPLPSIFLENAARHGFTHPLDRWEMLNFEGYECPSCGASDRERLYALFMRIVVRETVGCKLKLLDFAPSLPFRTFIQALGSFEYRTADLLISRYDDQVNIENMYQYPDNYFDCFICSHVIEHVKDDQSALNELFRILKPSGFGIIQSPISLFYESTYEDFSKTTEAQRWQCFGQGDHVRIYSRLEYIKRIQKAGFNLREYDIHFFGEQLFDTCSLTRSSVLYVGEKSCLENSQT